MKEQAREKNPTGRKASLTTWVVETIIKLVSKSKIISPFHCGAAFVNFHEASKWTSMKINPVFCGRVLSGKEAAMKFPGKMDHCDRIDEAEGRKKDALLPSSSRTRNEGGNGWWGSFLDVYPKGRIGSPWPIALRLDNSSGQYSSDPAEMNAVADTIVLSFFLSWQGRVAISSMIMLANDHGHSFSSGVEPFTVDHRLTLDLHYFYYSFELYHPNGLLADSRFSTRKGSFRVHRSYIPCKMPVLRLIRQRLLQEEGPRFNLVKFGNAIGQGSLFLLANILVNLVCNRASNEEANHTPVLRMFVHYIPVYFIHYFPLTIVTVIAWFIGHQFFMKKPGVLPVVAEPAHPQAIGHPHHQGTDIPLGTRPLNPQGTGPPHPQGTEPLDPQGTGPPHPQGNGPLLEPQRTSPPHPQANGHQHSQDTRTLDPQATGSGAHSLGSGTSYTQGRGDGPHDQGSGPSNPQGTGTLGPQRIEASHPQAIGHSDSQAKEQPPLQGIEPPHQNDTGPPDPHPNGTEPPDHYQNGTGPTDWGVVDHHLQLLIYSLKRHNATESMYWAEGSSGNAALTINFKGVNVREVERVFRSKLTLSGSKILHKRLEIGPETGMLELEEFRKQIIESMRRARILDPECTLQLGSFAVVKYTDRGHLKWWRLQRHWTPAISNIRGSPRSLLDLLRGSSKKWTIRGFNLQMATLKASTADESENLKVLSYHKMESGEDLLLCEEPPLVQNSAPMFSKAVYVCATNSVEIEQGVTINLQSEPKNVQRAYWMSVMESLLPSPWTMIMTLSLALLGGLSRGAYGTHAGLFPRLASRHLGLQHGDDIVIVGVNLQEDSFLSRIVSELYKSFLVYIFLIFILDLVVSLLRELSRAPLPRLGSDVTDLERTPDLEDINSSPERTPDLEDINSSLSPANPPSIQDNLGEDIRISSGHITPSRLDATFVHFQAEGDNIPGPRTAPASEDTKLPSPTSSIPQEEDGSMGMDMTVEEKGDGSFDAVFTPTVTDFDDNVSVRTTSASTAEDESVEKKENVREPGAGDLSPRTISPLEDSSNPLNPISPSPHDDKLKRIDVNIGEEEKGPDRGPEYDINLSVPTVIDHLNTEPENLNSLNRTDAEILQENEDGLDKTDPDLLNQVRKAREFGSGDHSASQDPSDARYFGKALPSSGLPSGWVTFSDEVEGEDPESGHVYYFNQSTGKTQRELPSGKDVVPPPPPPLALPPLPSNWREATDPRTGHRYYSNNETKLANWERPKPGNVTADQDTKPESSSIGTGKATFHDTSNSTAGPSKSDYGGTQGENDNQSKKKIWWRPFRSRNQPGKSRIGWRPFKSGIDYSWLSVKKDDLTMPLEGMPQRFSYKDLSLATRNFESKLGEGGSGTVYRGILPSSEIPVAVKKFQSDLTRGEREFKNELFIIGQLKHRNLVQLLGWCAELAKKRYLLVYKLIPNGNLADVLFEQDEKNTGCLSWPQRFNILTGLATALDYLHNGWNQQVIHRDVKCSNILLDEEWNAKLTDFGIARLVGHQDEAVITDVVGTFGYVAPEAAISGRFTDKADVYAFGAVVLEVACGRRAFSSNFPEEEMVLVDWVWVRLSEGDLLSTVDKRLGDYDPNWMEAVLMVGLLCSHPDPVARPSMRSVVQILNRYLPVPSIPTSKPGFSLSIYDGLHTPKTENTSISTTGSKSLVSKNVSSSARGSTAKTFATSPSLDSNSFNIEDGDPEVHLGQLKRFSLRELKVATDNFNNKNILGRNGWGTTYKGRLPDGSLVAVKRLSEKGSRGQEQWFQTEVEMISRAAHRNLLRLRGFCMTSTERLLVYPYMPNGTLASHLRERRADDPPLDWPTRKRISLGSARGLSYLHDHCDPKIIHRDVKAGNIFLDEKLEAVVSEFGLAKLMDHRDTHVTTAVRGTIGHIAPEYLSTGKASEKTDVFSFGIMLLELITGQRAFDMVRLANDDDVMLLDWVKGLLRERKVKFWVDPDLQEFDAVEVKHLLQVALLCTQSSPMERPKMAEVVHMLSGPGLAEMGGSQELELVPMEWLADSTEFDGELREIDLHSVELTEFDFPHAVELSSPR